MLKRTILALSVAVLTLAGLAQAQENATLTMRSGERVSGQLVDMGGSGFALRVNGQDRNIPTNDVAVIDFSGGSMSDADWAKVGNDQVVWLKNGTTVNGQLFDIGGTTPLRITFKTSSGEREFSSSEIARIVLSKPAAVATGGSGTGSLTPPTGSGVSVSPKQAWTSTGITVKKGEVVHFSASGEVQLSGDANDVATPSGSKNNRRATGAQLPNVLAGGLIGRIGTNAPFGIGKDATITMPAAGQLFLGVNDDGFDDNQGEFRVDIQRTASRR